MTHDAVGGAAGDAAGGGGPLATASYVSSTEVLEREWRLLARRQLSTAGFWRSFVRRRVVAAALVVVVVVSLAQSEGVTAAGALRGGVFLLLALGVLSAMDAWLTRRRVLRAHRVSVTAACPPGTVVTASYSPTELTFGLPGHRVVLDTASLDSGVHRGGLLVLEQAEGGVWVVPDELLGAHGLDVVRAALGDRLVEG